MDLQTEKENKEALLSIDKNTKTKKVKCCRKVKLGRIIEKNDKYSDIIRETDNAIKGYKIY
jgi:hypothetical protein